VPRSRIEWKNISLVPVFTGGTGKISPGVGHFYQALNFNLLKINALPLVNGLHPFKPVGEASRGSL
jgi:hypothetical protein